MSLLIVLRRAWQILASLSLVTLAVTYFRLPELVTTYVAQNGSIDAQRTKSFMLGLAIFSWLAFNLICFSISTQGSYDSPYLWRKGPFKTYREGWISSPELKALGYRRWQSMSCFTGCTANLLIIGYSQIIYQMNLSEPSNTGSIQVALTCLALAMAITPFVALKPPAAAARNLQLKP